jgi:EAL and modified HD-GYP domain-containing signal transduction protein
MADRVTTTRSEAASIEPTVLGSTVSGATVSRRALISGSGKVAGFEFKFNGGIPELVERGLKSGVLAGYAVGPIASAHLVAQAGRIGVARIPIRWLGLIADQEVSHGMLIALEAPTVDALEPQELPAVLDMITRLRASGAKLGWITDMDLPCKRDFVMICQNSQTIDAQIDDIARWPADLRNTPIVASDLRTLEDIERVLRHGVAFVCGAVMHQTQHHPIKDEITLPPGARRIGLLLTQVLGGAETQAIVSQIKRDAGLAYRLISRINSASYAHDHAITSIDHAVTILGRTELYRWLSILLLQYSVDRSTNSALQEITLWRSRLFELLAIERRESAADALFMLGLASMLGVLLKISSLDVCHTLNLPEPSRSALIDNTGPWAHYLEVSRHLETGAMDEHPELMQFFGGPAKVMDLSEKAWAWAAANSDSNASIGVLENLWARSEKI